MSAVLHLPIVHVLELSEGEAKVVQARAGMARGVVGRGSRTCLDESSVMTVYAGVPYSNERQNEDILTSFARKRDDALPEQGDQWIHSDWSLISGERNRILRSTESIFPETAPDIASSQRPAVNPGSCPPSAIARAVSAAFSDSNTTF